MIADMVLKTDASRMLVWRAGFLKDKGRPNTLETSVAKLHATEAAVECANTAIQVHGGAGYVDDHPVERYFRDVRVTTLYEGTSQIQKLIIGRAMTGINAPSRLDALFTCRERLDGLTVPSGGAPRRPQTNGGSLCHEEERIAGCDGDGGRRSRGWSAQFAGAATLSYKGGQVMSLRALGGGRMGRRLRDRERSFPAMSLPT